MTKTTQKRTEQQRLAQPHGSALPSASDLRTAARVLRWANQLANEAITTKPTLKRWWHKLNYENGNELMRKASLLNELADNMETPNAPTQRTAGH